MTSATIVVKFRSVANDVGSFSTTPPDGCVIQLMIIHAGQSKCHVLLFRTDNEETPS